MLFTRGPISPDSPSPMCLRKEGDGLGSESKPLLGKQDLGLDSVTPLCLLKHHGKRKSPSRKGDLLPSPATLARVRTSLVSHHPKTSQSAGPLSKGDAGQYFFWKTFLNVT